VCRPFGAAGATCISDYDCLQGTCDGGVDPNPDGGLSIAGTCKDPSPFSGSCSSDLGCGTATYCDAGTCQPQVSDGTPCEYDNQCLTQLCSYRDGGSSGVCGSCL
jgi:hypothetical protein